MKHFGKLKKQITAVYKQMIKKGKVASKRKSQKTLRALSGEAYEIRDLLDNWTSEFEELSSDFSRDEQDLDSE